MKQQLEQRLKELRAEYAAGQKVLGELENKQAELRKTLPSNKQLNSGS
jgi:uncharacterized coiled-coil protein SlyX